MLPFQFDVWYRVILCQIFCQVSHHFKHSELLMTLKDYGYGTIHINFSHSSEFNAEMMSSNGNPTQTINNILINYNFFFFCISLYFNFEWYPCVSIQLRPIHKYWIRCCRCRFNQMYSNCARRVEAKPWIVIFHVIGLHVS